MNAYPLDYQLALSQTIRLRLRAERSEEHAARLRKALACLHLADFGECSACGDAIPYAEILADPAAHSCRACRR
jgi:RNA polymerase-binding transcription factor DksA